MKILLADDHQLFLEGLQSILMGLGTDTEIETVYNGRDALEKLTEDTFDIALIDLRIPGIDGFGLLSELTKINCLVPVVLVTASEEPLDMQHALDLGAMGYVPKSSSAKQILDTVTSVLNGEISTPNNSPSMNNVVSSYLNWGSQHEITPRQMEVLSLIRRGMSNKAIADQLNLSLGTVKTHIAAIFQALGTRSRSETINKVKQLGLD